ncbi:bacteriohemerythrin [Teredinibacter turnerae]|uniref:Hemerythrin metal-binding domain protein n=1 Tax=Teredinibacter turnerae (strain ATCC 39867 / T7901) TaxID=377629 RepID=C5BQC1_TERTT|nr:bacteriohemerythrin [Teredinibacter turnerae]ACR13937.1 hemerythrin metal-binding domain protein [Teredinibacter turnerae T7901]
MAITWNSELELGIPVIDSQHRRIVEYINAVYHARNTHSLEEIVEVLDELVDYTLSHFAFEENLMEEAGYPFLNAHKKVHRLFARRVGSFQQRVKTGEDITEELLHVLKAWLINHIKCDDRDYSEVVRANMVEATRRTKAKKGSWFNRLFG